MGVHFESGAAQLPFVGSDCLRSSAMHFTGDKLAFIHDRRHGRSNCVKPLISRLPANKGYTFSSFDTKQCIAFKSSLFAHFLCHKDNFVIFTCTTCTILNLYAKFAKQYGKNVYKIDNFGVRFKYYAMFLQ